MSNYYSFWFRDEKQKSKYQINLQGWTAKEFHEQCEEEIDLMLSGQFPLKIDNLKKISEIEIFLNYQYTQYSGNKIDFLYNLKNIFNLYFKRQTLFNSLDPFATLTLDTPRYIPNVYEKYILEWIDIEEKKITSINQRTYINFNEIKEQHINKFVNILLNFIDELLNDDKINRLIRELNEGKKNEDKWRNYFRDCFDDYKKLNFKVIPEAIIRNDRIDLKVKNLSDNIEYKIEFKLWYNPDKKNIVQQIRKYLTDFDKYGFIIIINTNKTKDIRKEYEKIATNSDTKYKEKTWKPIKYNDYEFLYSSIHEIVTEKEIYHFIINPYRK